MPIWLRKFTFKKIKDFIDGQNEQMEQQTQNNNGSTTLISPDGVINKSEFKKQSQYYK